jgi:excisionase family DNA binding protein
MDSFPQPITTSETQPPSSKRSHSIKDICRDLGVSRSLIVKEIKLGRLRTCRIGKRVIILEEQLREYLSSRERMAA